MDSFGDKGDGALMLDQPSCCRVSPRTVRRRLWLIAAVLGLSLCLLFVAWLRPWNILLPASEPIPAQNEELHDSAVRVPDDSAVRVPNPSIFDLKGTLILPDGGLLEFRYCATADSGVDLRRLDHQDGNVLWEQAVAPLGVGHSEYQHEVFVWIEGTTLKVVSRGYGGTFVERLDLDSGKSLARSAKKLYSFP
jgi:hypothetical protein